MNVNYHLQGSGDTVVLIHGLFGSLDNLGVLGRSLQESHQVLQVDLRNHGLSPHSEDMNYRLMAEDVIALLNRLSLDNVTLIGHSMGGKVAMTLTALIPDRITRLAVIDIAPIAYPTRHHDDVFEALNAVHHAGITTRPEAAAIMRESGLAEGVIQFLLKSFHQGEWRFNVPALWQHYDEIIGWQEVPVWEGPTIFIRGELSPYIQESARPAIARQFPHARAYTVAGSGHWVHAEKPQQVISILQRFMSK